MNIAVLESGHVTQDDAAYPSLVRLDDDSIICGYSCGGGSMATGGTDWARSVDGGATWTREGTILPRVESPVMTNTLRLSRTPGGTVLAYGARRHDSAEAPRFGRDPSEPVICRSTDGGQSWSAPAVLPPDSLRASAPRAYEITCPILALDDRRWLASAALLADPKYLAGRVVVFATEDAGETWPRAYTVFQDPDRARCFFETKVVSMGKDLLLSVAWTVTAGDYQDRENHYATSRDGGATWTRPISTGIRGQTMTPVWIGDNRLLLLYNRRYGTQGIVMLVAEVGDEGWVLGAERMLWDAAAMASSVAHGTEGIDEFADFAFGLPSAMPLDDTGHLLAVHWCREGGAYGVRWTRIRVS